MHVHLGASLHGFLLGSSEPVLDSGSPQGFRPVHLRGKLAKCPQYSTSEVLTHLRRMAESTTFLCIKPSVREFGLCWSGCHVQQTLGGVEAVAATGQLSRLPHMPVCSITRSSDDGVVLEIVEPLRIGV